MGVVRRALDHLLRLRHRGTAEGRHAARAALRPLPQPRPGLLETLRVLPADLAAVDFGMHALLPGPETEAGPHRAGRHHRTGTGPVPRGPRRSRAPRPHAGLAEEARRPPHPPGRRGRRRRHPRGTRRAAPGTRPRPRAVDAGRRGRAPGPRRAPHGPGKLGRPGHRRPGRSRGPAGPARIRPLASPAPPARPPRRPARLPPAGQERPRPGRRRSGVPGLAHRTRADPGDLHPGRPRPVAIRNLQPPRQVGELRPLGGRPQARLQPHSPGHALGRPVRAARPGPPVGRRATTPPRRHLPARRPGRRAPRPALRPEAQRHHRPDHPARPAPGRPHSAAPRQQPGRPARPAGRPRGRARGRTPPSGQQPAQRPFPLAIPRALARQAADRGRARPAAPCPRDQPPPGPQHRPVHPGRRGPGRHPGQDTRHPRPGRDSVAKDLRRGLGRLRRRRQAAEAACSPFRHGRKPKSLP
jgi:hypothetical protein